MSETTNRRTFLKSTAAVSAVGALAHVPNFVHAQGDSGTLKVGLIGCGGRGTGAAPQALRPTATSSCGPMGDAFATASKASLHSSASEPRLAAKIDVPPDGSSPASTPTSR